MKLYKLLATFLISVITIFAIVSTMTFISIHEKSLIDGAKKNADIIADNISNSIYGDIVRGNLFEVRRKIQKIFSSKHFLHLSVVGSGGNKIITIPQETSLGDDIIPFSILKLNKEEGIFIRHMLRPPSLTAEMPEKLIGEALFVLDITKIRKEIHDTVYRMVILAFFLWLLSLGLIFWGINKVKNAFGYLINSIDNVDEKNLTASLIPSTKKIFIEEVKSIASHFNRMLERLKNYQVEIDKSKKMEIINNIASQVAHDIRSPLAALDHVMKDIDQLPEEKRVIVRAAVSRIHDIANDLLEKRKGLKREGDELPNSIENKSRVMLLSSLLESIITEKRIQYRSKMGVDIEASIGMKSYGLFAKIVPREFKRIVSNLINNAVEALPKGKGKIQISLERNDNNQVELVIEDDGKGIPPEIIDRLGKEELSSGKEKSGQSGSGIGIFHAVKTLKTWNGELKIDSTVGVGTKILITLPRQQGPEWFVPELSIPHDGNIVVVDDDNSIHQVWNGRFESLRLKEKGVSVFHFSNPEEFADWFKSFKEKTSVKFLIDYEYLGSKLNGIDLIKKLEIASKSYLVTSRFEEEHITTNCQNLKIGLIPKSMASFVPIRVVSDKKKVVLIDNDELIHVCWKTQAEKAKVALDLFFSPDDFFKKIDEYSLDTEIYIDADLGDGIRGEDVAKKLHQRGFKNLVLTTGYEDIALDEVPWIKGVIGKDCPL